MDDFRHSAVLLPAAASKLVLAPGFRRALHGRLPSSAGRRVKGAAASDRALREVVVGSAQHALERFDASTVEHW